MIITSKARRIAFCVTGWHFLEEVYAQLTELSHVDLFVISHKSPDLVPAFLFEYIDPDHLIFKPNLGYDWGCYQQFLETGIWQEYDTIFFMHDDLAIQDVSFVEACLDLLDQGYKVVGNGRNSEKVDWACSHLKCYAHARWKPPSRNFEHDTVRGSFLATTRPTLSRLGLFEVFWDPFHLYTRFGNWSLLATCGRLQAMFGDRTFAFLSNSYRVSPYLAEHERGNLNGDSSSAKVKPCFRGHWRLILKFNALSESYMQVYLEPKSHLERMFVLGSIYPIIRLVAGRRN